VEQASVLCNKRIYRPLFPKTVVKTPRNTQPLLAAWAFLAMVGFAGSADAQSIAITSSPNIGKVAAAASGVTVFRFSASSGSISKVSGSGSRVSTGSTRALVTLSCSSKWCNNNVLKITIGNSGSPTGRAGALTNFTAAMGNAVLNSGTPGTPANPQVFYIEGMAGSSRTFWIGADFPIYGDDQTGKATGTATSSFQVSMEDTNKNNAATPKTGTAVATVFHKLTISLALDPTTQQPMLLNFGRIVRPLSGSGSVIMPASTGARTVTGGVALSSPTPSRGGFKVTGEGGQTISVSVPSTITVTNTGPSGGSIDITTSNTAQGTQALSGSLGGEGSFTFLVGGAFAISDATKNGPYQGTYTVSVDYN
jgi:hypothetical protein